MVATVPSGQGGRELIWNEVASIGTKAVFLAEPFDPARAHQRRLPAQPALPGSSSFGEGCAFLPPATSSVQEATVALGGPWCRLMEGMEQPALRLVSGLP